MTSNLFVHNLFEIANIIFSLFFRNSSIRLPIDYNIIFFHSSIHATSAMARINMIKAAVSRRTSAHAPMDNVTTPYNPIRLLKGAPPGQVNFDFIII